MTAKEKRIVIHFTPYHGSCLDLVEFWFGILNKKVFNESYSSGEELQKNFKSFLDDWNTLFAHPFRWSYDGKGLHGKTVDRFSRVLNQAAHQIEIPGLTKQLKLILNLIKDYALEISTKCWNNLCDAFHTNETVIKEKIENEKGPKKKNADAALNNLTCQHLLKAA